MERINTVINSIVNRYSKDKDVIKKVSLVNGYCKYRYIVSLKLSDIERYLKDDYEYEVEDIVNTIRKYSNIFIGFMK